METPKTIESFLYDNPKLTEDFLEKHSPLLNQIKDVYAEMLKSGDLIGRFLLSTALAEILKTTTEAGQKLLKAEMKARGVYFMKPKGNC